MPTCRGIDWLRGTLVLAHWAYDGTGLTPDLRTRRLASLPIGLACRIRPVLGAQVS